MSGEARDLVVGAEERIGAVVGSDRSGGEAFGTIKEAIAKAQAGDVIHLDPSASPYNEAAVFADTRGADGAPIVLDGHGATIDGSIPLRPEEWETIGDGLYRSTVIPQEYCYDANPAYVGRFYFIVDGKMNRMGRSLKGSTTPYKAPEDLQSGEWTYVDAEEAFYLRYRAEVALKDVPVRVPKIVSGVQFTGDCHYVTVRNVTVTHVINDGFALTTGHAEGVTVSNIRFEDIVAVNCGDDGLSAHGDCEVFVDGFVSRGNSTGYCSQGTSVNRRVFIEDIDGVEIYPLGGRHEFVDTVVIGNALRPVTVETTGDFKTSELILKNCLILGAPGRDPSSSLVRVLKGGTLIADRLTTFGVGYQVAGEVEVSNSIIAGGTGIYVHLLPDGTWAGSRNLYDVGLFRVVDDRINAADFDQFVLKVGESDSETREIPPFSRSASPSNIPDGIGADYNTLPLGPEREKF